MKENWFVLDVNPEPWAIGPVGVGRRGGKTYAYVGRNDQLWHYQQAIKSALGDPGVYYEGPIQLDLFFWRRRDEYQTHQARTHRKHEADGTNICKATEDALQGVLFKNDKDCADVHWKIVAQGPDVVGKVVVRIREYISNDVIFPLEVQTKIDEIDYPTDTNTWSNNEC